MDLWLTKIGWVASVALPFFNIPLIVRIVQRRSSDDVSIIWAFGIFTCMIGMTPASLLTGDVMFKVFTVMNLILFSVVLFCVVYFRIKRRKRM
jgi:uncharacterized protein with PQ loop repeat